MPGRCRCILPRFDRGRASRRGGAAERRRERGYSGPDARFVRLPGVRLLPLPQHPVGLLGVRRETHHVRGSVDPRCGPDAVSSTRCGDGARCPFEQLLDSQQLVPTPFSPLQREKFTFSFLAGQTVSRESPISLDRCRPIREPENRDPETNSSSTSFSATATSSRSGYARNPGETWPP